MWLKYFSLLLTNLRVIINAAFPAHYRTDQYIQVKFRGLHAGRIFKEDIRPILEDRDQFLVRSRQDNLTEYQFDMNIGTCTCVTGRYGSPCSHQLAVAINSHRYSLNCIPSNF